MSELDKLDGLSESLEKVRELIDGVSKQAIIHSLERELKDKQCQIEEMRQHIECLKEDLAEAQGDKIRLPHEPIKVAELLIYAEYSYKNKFTGMQHRGSLYPKSELRQIAEHLLVYCNNFEDEE